MTRDPQILGISGHLIVLDCASPLQHDGSLQAKSALYVAANRSASQSGACGGAAKLFGYYFNR